MKKDLEKHFMYWVTVTMIFILNRLLKWCYSGPLSQIPKYFQHSKPFFIIMFFVMDLEVTWSKLDKVELDKQLYWSDFLKKITFLEV